MGRMIAVILIVALLAGLIALSRLSCGRDGFDSAGQRGRDKQTAPGEKDKAAAAAGAGSKGSNPAAETQNQAGKTPVSDRDHEGGGSASGGMFAPKSGERATLAGNGPSPEGMVAGQATARHEPADGLNGKLFIQQEGDNGADFLPGGYSAGQISFFYGNRLEIRRWFKNDCIAWRSRYKKQDPNHLILQERPPGDWFDKVQMEGWIPSSKNNNVLAPIKISILGEGIIEMEGKKYYLQPPPPVQSKEG